MKASWFNLQAPYKRLRQVSCLKGELGEKEGGVWQAREGRGGAMSTIPPHFLPFSPSHIHSFFSLFQTVVKRLNCLRVRSTASSSGWAKSDRDRHSNSWLYLAPGSLCATTNSFIWLQHSGLQPHSKKRKKKKLYIYIIQICVCWMLKEERSEWIPRMNEWWRENAFFFTPYNW